MSEARKDTVRATAAARAIVDGRTLDEASAILVTLEHVVATILLLTEGTPARAAAMLNEGVTPGVELRLINHRKPAK